jgi:Mn-dependent DtxR family transcriptional regulator
MGRLHAAGLIHDPVGKAKSVVLTEEGEKRSRELFQKHFERSA